MRLPITSLNMSMSELNKIDRGFELMISLPKEEVPTVESLISHEFKLKVFGLEFVFVVNITRTLEKEK